MAEGETIGESGQELKRPRGSLLNHPVGQREQPVGNASAEAFTVSASIASANSPVATQSRQLYAGIGQHRDDTKELMVSKLQAIVNVIVALSSCPTP